MYYYNIAFLSRCKDCKESDEYPELLKKLWKQLIQQLPESHDDEYSLQSLPKCLRRESKNLFQLLPSNKEILDKNSEVNENEWLNLSENKHKDLALEEFLKDFMNSVNWNNLDYAQIIAEQLHNIADSINKSYVFNIYWITCENAQCIESSDNIAIHGALKRLQKWNKASLTFVCHSDKLCEKDFTNPWFRKQNIHVSKDDNLIQDNNLVWQGSLECLGYNENDENNDWCLSRTMSSSQTSNLPYSKEDSLPFHLEEERCVLADNIKIIRDFPNGAVPLWKIFPSQFVLYHKILLKRVFELQGQSDFDLDKSVKNRDALLASIAIYDEKHQSEVKSTQDWVEFITSESSNNDKVKTTFPVIETYYVVLYPVEPGIFLAYFIRPEDCFTNLHSLLAIYPAIFSCTEHGEEKNVEDSLERRWLQLLDAIKSSHESPLKSQFSLAVHLDAFEMLKHFKKDGKPIKKELESLLKQIEEQRNISPSKQTEIQQRREMVAGVEYCSDETSEVSTSTKLLPKHETLSICNTPKTLAKAKLHDVKRTVTKEMSTSSTDKLKQLEHSKKKKLRRENPGISNEKSNKETKVKRDGKEKTKKKRRSFDGNETVKTTDEKERRSDRHKRRLARVVKRTLIKYGVDTAEEYFTTCSERLYYMCKSFLKDLQTSEGLNNEMKRLAESNVATVVEFEKRRYTNKATEKVQTNTTTNSEKVQTNSTTNSDKVQTNTTTNSDKVQTNTTTNSEKVQTNTTTNSEKVQTNTTTNSEKVQTNTTTNS